ncbi:creatininase family protein [Actinomadura sp. LOL_016]|uniref:creatininase family protein n=1 Tax=unclassified Actinomadura TaxID=2626254 RepID=UPI003A80AFC8
MEYSIFAGSIADMTYTQVMDQAAAGAVALLPVGVIEQHGPHLPLGTDIYGAYQLCRLVQRRLRDSGVAALLAPPFYWGVNHVTSAFPGSFVTRRETAEMLLDDMLDGLAQAGFRSVFAINHHGDLEHNRMLADVFGRRPPGRPDVRFLDDGTMCRRLGQDPSARPWLVHDIPPEWEKLPPSPVLGVHAHDVETSLVVRYFPELVDHAALAGLPPTDLTPDDLAEWRRGGEHARRVTPDGYFGDPRPADPDLWRRYDVQAREMARAVQGASTP